MIFTFIYLIIFSISPFILITTFKFSVLIAKLKLVVLNSIILFSLIRILLILMGFMKRGIKGIRPSLILGNF